MSGSLFDDTGILPRRGAIADEMFLFI